MYVKCSDDTILNTDLIAAVQINPMNESSLLVYIGREKPISVYFNSETECEDYLLTFYKILSSGAK